MRVGEYEEDENSDNESGVGDSQLEEMAAEPVGAVEAVADEPEEVEEEKQEDNTPKFVSQWQYKKK
jgi:hypothetical protein